MELRAGYKRTEVGVIPEAWEVRPMGQIGTLTMGKGLLKSDILLSGLIPAIPYTALYTDFAEVLDYKDIKWFVNDEKSTHIANEPCVLIASSSNMEANTGKATALSQSRRVAIGREVIAYRTSCDSRYVSYLLSTAAYRRKTLSVARGTTIKHVYPATFVDYQIAVPPATEQYAIATALSNADALLAKIDQLIAKKRDLKQAAMQQLLTGQTRLPGFSGEWEVKRLADIAQINPGINKPVSAMGAGVLYVTVQDLYSGNSVDIDRLGRIRLSAQERVLYALQPGDIIFGKSSVKRDGIAYPSIFRGAPEPAVCTGFSYRARVLPDLADANYVFYALRWEPTRKWLIEHSQASALTNINKAISDAIPISLPELEEQTAIAAILSDMGAELAALEARRDKTRALKQGMMQALLTGRIRLAVVN